ncbi:prolyl oligopeptidase family serine peptidase [Nonomuraea roseoviolacea]|uniref:Dipeptidyl aminopeptidase/acylaminoacyl peptidase n=1 Tax=Nonomuraea roseoviolacea subsp. carminata TaxID=160689 RepID=A0ABT1K012_9ACTN|nr:prolyl oligopeptidase family serine peptidase [Nonomuraea roseoviolacea]MCP2347338.1 dipeptidyl aminopeptidase/acylaminoacyl peptidase [Nonomuraea roseoviolacea subsp. carminata]
MAPFPALPLPALPSPASLDAWACWNPSPAPDRDAVAYVSDRDGCPRLWIQPLPGYHASAAHVGAPAGRAPQAGDGAGAFGRAGTGRDHRPGPVHGLTGAGFEAPGAGAEPDLLGGVSAWPVETGPEPVCDVSWAPTGARLAVLVAPGGGEHTQVWTVRPDGGDLRPLAAPPGGSASFVRWTGRGEDLLVAETSAEGVTEAVLVDAATGGREVVAAGALLRPAAVSRDHGTLLLRRGPRGARRMSLIGRGPGADGERPLLAGLPGSTDYGILSPDGETAYLLSDAGRDRPALLTVSRSRAVQAGREHAMPVGREHAMQGVGWDDAVRAGREYVVLAGRDDAELDQFALTPDGRWAVLVWNEHGRSALGVLDTGTGAVTPLPPLPADVVTSIRMSLDGATAVMAAESPDQPSHVLLCDLATGRYEEVAGLGQLAHAPRAELIEFEAHDGLGLTAWLYRPPAAQGPAPYLVFLHGGPEDQERPTFNPLYHNLLAAGIGVLAPNVRGSSGHGRAFREADDRELRFHAIEDVADCATELVRLGVADPGRLACMGWSYGGYLTLAALVTHPRLFRTGIDVCGMSDFESFYARTEPWIAAAAVGEYGHPERDRDLLRALSPLRHFDRLEAPLLVVHGVHDTNVPVYEAEQAVRAARARGVVCEELLFPDEGHEIRRPANRVVFVGRVVDWLTRHLLKP